MTRKLIGLLVVLTMTACNESADDRDNRRQEEAGWLFIQRGIYVKTVPEGTIVLETYGGGDEYATLIEHSHYDPETIVNEVERFLEARR